MDCKNKELVGEERRKKKEERRKKKEKREKRKEKRLLQRSGLASISQTPALHSVGFVVGAR
jgi:hypothetical protein